MKLTALRMHNVKRFAACGVAIEGIGDGVNVLCAANEYGKSTSFEALHALFFQPYSSTAGDIRNLRPYSGGNPLVEADIATVDRRYRITKQFYGGRSARVVDLTNERLVAQADEAENFIAGLISGGAGGPAGLLWVRQGVTGVEKRSRAEEESDKQVRAGLLESVQGEVEAMTGGRRMAEIMAATAEACDALMTPTGRAKSGGRYAAAIDLRDRLATEEQRQAGEVDILREALDLRGAAQRRLTELEAPDERAARRGAVEIAEAACDTARAQNERLKTVEAELNLARERKESARREHRQFTDALAQAQSDTEQMRAATERRDEAVGRQHSAMENIKQARIDADAAEDDARVLRELLDRLDSAERAQVAAERLVELHDRLRQADEIRGAVEDFEARLAQARLPAGAVEELAQLDVEIAQFRAFRDAARPSVTVAYDDSASARVAMNAAVLNDGEERGYDGHAELVAPGIGTISLNSNLPEQDDDRLDTAEAKRRTLLASMGVADLAEARAQQVRAQGLETQAGEARGKLAVLAPEGLDKLRAAAAAHVPADPAAIELQADPVETRATLEAAEQRRREAGQALKAVEPVRTDADAAFVRAQTELATLQASEKQTSAILGPAVGRDVKGQELADQLRERETALADAHASVDAQRAAASDLDAAEATLVRVRSVETAAQTEIQQLREKIAGLNAQITARADEAIEEKWRETAEELAAAQVRVAAFEHEVAVLMRLSQALDTARSNARDLYLTPVMNELRPLLGLLFDDVCITFDERTLLPQTILRGGQEEEVERLSGGMREQLSILTRLAFARLLARDGRPAPVILDDALVYSDDDRIERMFDALHRQARDQQIIVFSCRQRAFQKLGGNVLQMTDWQP